MMCLNCEFHRFLHKTRGVSVDVLIVLEYIPTRRASRTVSEEGKRLRMSRASAARRSILLVLGIVFVCFNTSIKSLRRLHCLSGHSIDLHKFSSREVSGFPQHTTLVYPHTSVRYVRMKSRAVGTVKHDKLFRRPRSSASHGT